MKVLLIFLISFLHLKLGAEPLCDESLEARLELSVNFIAQKNTELKPTNYRFVLKFNGEKEGKLCIKKIKFVNEEITEETILNFNLKSLAKLSEEKRSIIKLPFKIQGKSPGLLFISKKTGDPTNFLGISFPKEIKVWGSEWGWYSLNIEDNNFVNYEGTKKVIKTLEAPNESIVYKEKLGYKIIPYGIKKLLVNGF